MTDKTEAQPEALRLAAEFEDCIRIDAIPSINDVKKSAAELRRLHAEIQQLKAQPSARQAAPVMVVTEAMHVAAVKVLHRANGVDGLPQRMLDAMLSAAPPPPEREPQKHDKNRELAETAMRFVDRAGDVHPGIDDADRICAEFHAAMMEVIEKWHPMPMPPGIGATND